MEPRISGKELAQKILEGLSPRIRALADKSITPGLAIISVGDDPASQSYIRQKMRTAQSLGIAVKLFPFSKWVTYQKIAETIHRMNEDIGIHGIIIQRPLPPVLRTASFDKAVSKKKDVDGFLDKSLFVAPVARVAMHVLETIFGTELFSRTLKSKRILILGRGETAGKPITEELHRHKIPHIIVHSKTVNREDFMKTADIIISCVGKPYLIKKDNVKPGVILIGFGISSVNGKLRGDYDDEEMKDVASHYTPTPGGTGPLTVAFLLDNVVEAAEKMPTVRDNRTVGI